MAPTLDLTASVDRPRIQLDSGEFELRVPDDMNLATMVKIENLQKKVQEKEESEENIALLSDSLHELIRTVFIGDSSIVDNLSDIQCLKIMMFYRENVPPFVMAGVPELPDSNTSTAEALETG